MDNGKYILMGMNTIRGTADPDWATFNICKIMQEVSV